MGENLLRWGSGVVLTVAVVASVAADSAPKPTAPTPPTLDDARKLAASAGKALVLEFSTDWCSACKVFEQQTLPDPNVQAALANVMFVRYDAEAAPGDEAARRYKVHVFPTFIAVDENGVDALRTQGAADATGFVAWLGDARAATETEASVRTSLSAKPADPSVAIAAARWYASRARTKEALAQYDRLAKITAASKEQRAEAARTAKHLRRTEQWKQTLIADSFANITRDPGSTTADELAIATVGSGADAKSIRAAIKAALDATSNPDVLNDLIYVALAAGITDEALRAAERMVKAKRTPQLMDTFAETLHANGNKTKALAIEDEALAMPNGSLAALKRNRVRFASGTGDAEEVLRIRARASELWARLAVADQLPDRVPVAAAERKPVEIVRADDELVAYQKALGEASRALAKACRASSGAEMEGAVRLKFDASGAIIVSSIMLDASAPAGLRTCLAKEIATLKLKVPKRTTKVTLPIEFR